MKNMYILYKLVGTKHSTKLGYAIPKIFVGQGYHCIFS